MEPRQCYGCPKITDKGYSKDPMTGRESKSDFYCDDCYERGMQRESQGRVHSRNKAQRDAFKVSNRRDARPAADY